MSCTYYYKNELYVEDVTLKEVASQFGTPVYVYSHAAMTDNWKKFSDALQSLKHQICYAVKANSNIAILQIFSQLNAGFDIVSAGELERALVAGGDPQKIIFSGVGKTSDEIEYAIKKNIYCFDVESESEFERLQQLASQLHSKINIAFRINPHIDPKTHSYISTGLKENKFGIEIKNIFPLCEKLKSYTSLNLIGIACHIGSQITDLGPFSLAFDCLIELYDELKKMGMPLRHINIGGGLGITYHKETPPSIHDYATILKEKIASRLVEIIIEPGRAMVGNAGALLTKVEYLKQNTHKNFAIIDAGMNDLLRPALYHAWQNILPVQLRDDVEKKYYDIAGPICESSDFLGKDRELAILPHDLLAIDSAGAYGFSMSSNYNSRCRPAEVLIDKDKIHLIRRRESMRELLALESLI